MVDPSNLSPTQKSLLDFLKQDKDPLRQANILLAWALSRLVKSGENPYDVVVTAIEEFLDKGRVE